MVDWSPFLVAIQLTNFYLLTETENNTHPYITPCYGHRSHGAEEKKSKDFPTMLL